MYIEKLCQAFSLLTRTSEAFIVSRIKHHVTQYGCRWRGVSLFQTLVSEKCYLQFIWIVARLFLNRYLNAKYPPSHEPLDNFISYLHCNFI